MAAAVATHPRSSPSPLAAVFGVVAVVAPVAAIVTGAHAVGAAAVAVGCGLAGIRFGTGDVARVGGLAGLLLALPAALLAVVPSGGAPVVRVAGTDAVATSLAVSQEAFARADAAVVVGVEDPADALAAASLAGSVGGPLLLARSPLPAAVSDELERLGVSRVYAVGAVATDAVRAAGLDDVVAVTGDEVDVAVAERVGGDRAYVATRWEDAAGVTARAAAEHAPVIVLDGPRLDPPTRWWAAGSGVRSIVVVGATARVGDLVDQLTTVAPAAAIDRVGGDRYDISAAAAHRSTHLWVASGTSWGDVAAASAGAASQGRPLLLAPDRVRSGGGTARWFARHGGQVRHVTVVGGSGAYPNGTLRALLAPTKVDL